jgi:glutathione S-transferase
MPTKPDVTLRYFNARGRAQFLRYYLRARNIAFTDERVALSADFAAWAAMRDDRMRTGPFQKLPVLDWHGVMIAETLVIAAFLHRSSGDDGRLSDQENLRHAMLASSVYGDLMVQIGILIWSDIAFPGVDVSALTARTLDRIRKHLASLERTLAEWQWLAGLKTRPLMLADCILWEELDVARLVFGEHLQLERHATLAQFHRECPSRPVFEQLLAEYPCQISGRPGEAQAIANFHGILAAGAQ